MRSAPVEMLRYYERRGLLRASRRGRSGSREFRCPLIALLAGVTQETP